MNNDNSERARHIAADFTLYLKDGCILIRPETPTAQRHIEENVGQYEKWLMKFHFVDGSSVLFGSGPGGGIFLKPRVDLGTLSDALVNRGFIVVRDEKQDPPFVRLVIGATYGNKSPWLLHIHNCQIPRELSKMIIRGAGKPN